jgi:hypothetical protein
MRSGTFLVIFGTIFVVLTCLVRLPYGPQPLAGASPVVLGAAEQCLRLRYDYEQDVGSFPAAVRLRSELVPWNHDWFVADRASESRGYSDIGWRPAGPDSIDIAWHHSPIVRLPSPRRTSDDSLVGRMAAAGFTPLFFHGDKHSYRVVAHRVNCAATIARAT